MFSLGVPSTVIDDSAIVCDVFYQCFAGSENTVLQAGGAEPEYLPGQNGGFNRIVFRSDYTASALHEVAHWCIAGAQRRRLHDYGYWYQADGRDPEQQKKFAQVEARPQALEWLFSTAARRTFSVSIDNLDGEPVDPFGFELAVWQQLNCYIRDGLPRRAALFYAELVKCFQTSEVLGSRDYSLQTLCSRFSRAALRVEK